MEDFQLLWEDEALIAVNKPAGLLTIRDGYNPSLLHLAGLLETRFGRVWVVHRLDKDTSGVMLFARTAGAHRALNIQFEQRQTRKEYHAIVVGQPAWNEIIIHLPLRVNGDCRHRTVIDHQNGKPADTDARVLQTFAGMALLAAFPHTGYTHQIRAHLAALDLPILNDPLYRSLQPTTQAGLAARDKARALPIARLALHAFQISFRHPITGQELAIQAPYAPDFEKTLLALSGSRS